MEHKYKDVIDYLQRREFKAIYVATKEEAAKEVLSRIPAGSSVGVGGSVTIEQLQIEDALSDKGCEVYWHWRAADKETGMQKRKQALAADFYLASSNALTKDGRLVNIDGMGNRVMGMVFGPPRVILVIGINKLTDDLDAALKRVHNVATPKNARRLKMDPPCAETNVCVDCMPPKRACKVTTIIERKPTATEIEIILVGEELGF